MRLDSGNQKAEWDEKVLVLRGEVTSGWRRRGGHLPRGGSRKQCEGGESEKSCYCTGCGGGAEDLDATETKGFYSLSPQDSHS